MKIIISILIIISTNFISAQWIHNYGPRGGDILTIKCLGNNIFTDESSEGPYISTNNGVNWNKITNGLTSGVYSFARNQNYLFAGGTGGIYRSSDEGTTWKCIDSLVDKVNSLVVKDSLILGAAYYSGICRSTDNGLTWSISLNGIGPQDIKIINNYCIASSNNGIFTSDDYGLNWHINNGIPYYYIYSLDIFSNKIYVGALIEGIPYIYTSTDFGSSWQIISDSAVKNLYYFAMTDYNGMGYIAERNGPNIFKSTDNGVSWLKLPVKLPKITSITSNSNGIYIGTYNEGIFLSTDSGVTWENVNNNMPFQQIGHFTVQGANVFAGYTNGVVISNDLGTNWSWSGLFNSYGDGIFYGDGILSISAFEDTLFVCSITGLFRSKDKGLNWTKVSSFQANTIIYDGSKYYYLGTDQGVYCSTNNGDDWNSIGLPGTGILMTKGDTVFAGVSNSIYVYTRINNNWTKLTMDWRIVEG
jgi:photosystem II stability/assembly factor-like uncharacterized protein